MPFDAGPRPPHDDPDPTHPRLRWTWLNELADWIGRLTFGVAFVLLYGAWLGLLFGTLR